MDRKLNELNLSLHVKDSESLFPDMRTTIVCIDQIMGGYIKGKFYNLSQTAPEEFISLSDMVLKMDTMYDAASVPQAVLATRSFSAYSIKRQKQTIRLKVQHLPMDCAKYDAMISQRKGKLGTFHINVRFRQNASWQGELYWLEEKKKIAFRSVLELMFLLQEAVVNKHESKTEKYEQVC